jgi:hypothetical protein
MWGLWGRIARAISKYRISRLDSKGFRAWLSAAFAGRGRCCSTCCGAMGASIWWRLGRPRRPGRDMSHQSVTNDGPFRPILSETARKIGRFSRPGLGSVHKRLTLHMESSPTDGAAAAHRLPGDSWPAGRRQPKRNHAAKPPQIPPVTSLTSKLKTAHGRGTRFLDAGRGKRG